LDFDKAHCGCDGLKTDGRAALILSVENEFEDGVALLLDRGASCNHTNGNGDSCLHIAVEQGNSALVSLLIRSLAEVEFRNAAGDTPLICAAKHDCSPMINLLCQNKADPAARNVQGLRASDYAVGTTAQTLVLYEAPKEPDSTFNRGGYRGRRSRQKSDD